MYSGIWMYAWDLADEGVDHVMGWAAESGLQALQIAGAYWNLLSAGAGAARGSAPKGRFSGSPVRSAG